MKLLDLLYPPSCPLCGDVLKEGMHGFCDACRGKVDRVKTPVCEICGKEIAKARYVLCEDCARRPKHFVKGFPAFNYVPPMNEGIYRFKYHFERCHASVFAGEIVKTHGKEILSISPEVLIPVPIHKKKLRKRGYNQAEILAGELSRLLGIPVDASVLIRGKNTVPQKKLSPEERKNNLKTAFLSTQNRVNYRSVLLVDDIYTTGATIEACTERLLEAGVSEVYYTSICIGKGY